MIDLVDYFRTVSGEIDDCLRAPAVRSTPLAIDHDRLPERARRKGSFAKLFGKDFVPLASELEESAPLTMHVLQSMVDAGKDPEEHEHALLADTRYVIPSVPRAWHTDLPIHQENYELDVARAAGISHSVWANVCQTAQISFEAIWKKCPEGIDPRFFFLCIIRTIHGEKVADHALRVLLGWQEAQLQFGGSLSVRPQRQISMDEVKRLANELLEEAIYVSAPRSATHINFLTLHGITFRHVSPKAPNSEKRHRLKLKSWRPAAQLAESAGHSYNLALA